MGRRKERRHASAAGRRVKLDLFAEPSGDTAGDSTREVGGDGNVNVVEELPSSPLSSGKRTQNPLLLLGQYSDEELDEGSSDKDDHALLEGASVADDLQEKIATGKESKDSTNNVGNEPPIQNEEYLPMDSAYSLQGPLLKLENGTSTNTSEDLLGATNNTEESQCLTAPYKQPTEDLTSGWKMVLHEESNQYYYWNIETGETSWEVPEVLALRSSTYKETIIEGGTVESTSLAVEKGEINTTNLEGGSKLNCEAIDAADNGIGMRDGHYKQSKRDSCDDDDVNRDTDQSCGTSSHGHITMVNGNKLDLECSVETETGTVLPLQLVKHCEILLEKLKSLNSGHTEGQDRKLRCILEIEVRLADIKALEPHGTSLLPFWLHCEAQIKQMEATIDNFIECFSSSPMTGTDHSCKSREGTQDDILIDSSGKKASLTAVGSFSPEGTAEKLKFGAQCDGALNTAPVDVGVTNESKGVEVESKLNLKPDPHSSDEVDMDVDMEVEETSASVASIHYPQLELSHHPASQDSAVPGQILVGPPLVGEWIPPPPPEDEPFPPLPPDGEPFLPPPPDEPPEPPSYPPVSHSETVQLYPFNEHFTPPYPASGFEYYGQIQTDVSGTSLYMHPGGMQAQYYEGGYAAPSVVVNPVESSGYYCLQTGMLSATLVIGRSAAESSRSQSETFPETQESDASGSLLAHAGFVNPPGVPDVQPPVETSKNCSENNNVSASSSNTTVHIAAAAATATTSKIQPKASRGKKRTAGVISTLRPNKKVSSLVDKWKAVKEELHEEEEEPENAYEILEKKKQKEIEEWRVQHIASGEANENANFQPLGGDWRERVKRRMAQKKKETRRNSPDLAPVDGNQQPNLVEISRGLPSGWQAHWDDTSKQVYYANILTSETTWSRPTD